MIILAHAVDHSPIPAVALQRGDIRNAPVITYSFPEPSHPDFTGGAVERANSFAFQIAGDWGDDATITLLPLLVGLRDTHGATLQSGSELDFVMSLIA